MNAEQRASTQVARETRAEKEQRPGIMAFKFPGQGSQHPRMAEGLLESSVARSTFEEASEILKFDLLDVCINGSEDDLRPTEIAQSAILATSVALLAVARELNPNLPDPAFYFGHSLGEYTAFVASGALEFNEAVKLIKERSRIMKQGCLNNPGGMTAISGEGINIELINEICRGISEKGRNNLVQIANINTPEQVVISGTHAGLDEACSFISDLNGFRITPLEQVAGAYHSLLMDPENEFSKYVSNANFKNTRVPVILNTTGKPTASGQEMKEGAKIQHVTTVRHSESVRFALNYGVKTFVQFGPGNVLIALLRKIDRSANGIRISDLKSASDFANSHN